MSDVAANLHSVITSWIQAVGVLIAAAAFLYTLLSSGKRRAVERYEDITSRWIEYLRTCREHADLELGPLGAAVTSDKDARRERIATAAFLEALVLLERIYVLQSQDLSPVELRGQVLKEMLMEYAQREEFLYVWRRARGWFDIRFATFVDEAIHQYLDARRRESTCAEICT